MAIHNDYRCYGQVNELPRIFKNEESGEYVRAMCSVTTIRAKHGSGSTLENVRYDCPIIRTSNKDQIAEINSWNVNDMIEVKGTIVTKETVRKTKCPHCGGQNEMLSNVAFVHPIYLSKRESNISKNVGMQLLRSRCEISNNVTVIGQLVKDPVYMKTDAGAEITQYMLAVKRKYRIMEDPPEKKVDFLWVASFGVIAKRDHENLKKGSVVLVDGYLQSSAYKKECVCSFCNEKYQQSDSATQIVPYSVEYLKGMLDEDEQAKMKAEADEQIIQDVLNDLGKKP